MDGFRKVEDLSLEDLRDEVWLWRSEAAARLFFLLPVAKDEGETRGAVNRAKSEINGLATLLTSAVTGDYHETCFACGFAIRPGDAVISDVTEGEMHAACPDVEGGSQTAKPGDKIYMDPEGIVIDEDHPEGGDPAAKPDHIVAHEASRIYTDEEIAAQIEAARAVVPAR